MKKFENADYAQIVRIGGLKVSPDGTRAVYTATVPDVKTDEFQTSLWLVDLEKETETQLTAGPRDGGAVWLDGERLLFASPRKEDPKNATAFYCIDVRGGEAAPYMTVPLPGAQVSPLGEDRFLVRAVTDANQDAEKRTDKWMFVTEFPFKWDGLGYVSKMRRALFDFDRKTGELKQLTPRYMQVASPFCGDDVIVDGDRLFYTGWEYETDYGAMRAVYRYDRTTGEHRKLGEYCGDTVAMARADGRIWAIDLSQDGPRNVGSFIVRSMPETGGEMRTELIPEWAFRGFGSGSGRNVFARTVKAKNELLEWKGGLEAVPVPTGTVEPMEPVPAGKDGVLFVGWEKDRLPEVWLAKGGKTVQLSHRNDSLFRECAFTSCEEIETTVGGHTVSGWVMKPVGYEPGKKYPGILTIHGGPHMNYDPRFAEDFQRWATEGYFVFFCNPRGSTSYGLAFKDVSGDLMARAFEDVMAFTDAVLAAYPAIDPDRLGVTGYSYGGIQTNWVITHTDRFKAAVARASACNWITMRSTSDMRVYCDEMIDATFLTDFEKVWRQSPLAYADRVKTPTLFIQQENDYRCPLEQAEQMFGALNTRGIPTKLLVNFGGSHGRRKISQILHDCDTLIAWFDQYVK